MDTETVEQTRTTGPEVGDVLVSSWGYDQTNIDFWRVVSLTASGKSARIVPAGSRVVEQFTGGERVVPDEGDVFREQDEVTTSRIRWFKYGGGVLVDGESRRRPDWCVGVPVGHRVTARLWDGRSVFQTAFGWGH